MTMRIICAEGKTLKEAMEKLIKKANEELEETEVIISTSSIKKKNGKVEACFLVEKT
ncbi:MAG: hypothetical protein NDF54_10920 [archaeon GB-1867-035]|nr:hypothetical protein [Candidatus Culexmicrobium profundum]